MDGGLSRDSGRVWSFTFPWNNPDHIIIRGKSDLDGLLRTHPFGIFEELLD